MIFFFFLFWMCSPNLSFTHSHTSQALKIIEANMSALALSSNGSSQPMIRPNQPTTDVDETDNVTAQPMDVAVVDSGMSIGARIMRQFRRNSVSSTTPATRGHSEKSSDLTKKKNMNSKAIEKLYLNKTLGRLKHTQLETIFEHDDETNPDANENYTLEPAKVFGKRKIKRSMSCSDGFNTSKTLKQKRKNRIRKIFGVHKKIKSISMKKFMEHLQVNNDSVDFIAPTPSLPLTAITNGA